MTQTTNFLCGDRVKLSYLGIESLNLKGKEDRIGTIISKSGTHSCPRLVWDGNSPKSIYAYHPSFLEKVE